jgi:hypothetical protein
MLERVTKPSGSAISETRNHQGNPLLETVHLVPKDGRKARLGAKVLAGGKGHLCPRRKPSSPLFVLEGRLLKQHVRPNNHLAACERGTFEKGQM